MFEFVICDLICVSWCLCAQGCPKSPGHPVGLPGIAMRLAPAASCCWALAKVAGLEHVVILRLFSRVLAPSLKLFAVYSGVDFCGFAQLQRAG